MQLIQAKDFHESIEQIGDLVAENNKNNESLKDGMFSFTQKYDAYQMINGMF